MSSLIMSVLGIGTSDIFFSDKANLYHDGDDVPFANLTFKDGHAHLRVNSGERIDKASSVYLGQYDSR